MNLLGLLCFTGLFIGGFILASLFVMSRNESESDNIERDKRLNKTIQEKDSKQEEVLKDIENEINDMNAIKRKQKKYTKKNLNKSNKKEELKEETLQFKK